MSITHLLSRSWDLKNQRLVDPQLYPGEGEVGQEFRRGRELVKGFLEVEAVDLGLERRMRIGNGRRKEDQWEQRCGLNKSWACMGKIEKEVLTAGWDGCKGEEHVVCMGPKG